MRFSSDDGGSVAPVVNINVLGHGIPSAEALGVPTLAPSLDVQGSGILSAEAFGLPTLAPPIDVSGDGIPSAEALGSQIFLDGEVYDWGLVRVPGDGGSVSRATLIAVNDWMLAVKAAGLRSKLYRVNLYAGTGMNWAAKTGAPFIPLIKDKGAVKDSYAAATGTATYVETGAGGGLNIGAATQVQGTTGLIPNIDFASTASCHIATYIMSTATAGHWTVATAAPAGTFQMYLPGSTQFTTALFDNTGLSSPIAAGNGIGFTMGNRSAAAGAGCVQVYNRGISLNTGAVAATGLPSKDWAPWTYHDDVPLYQAFWLGLTGGYSIGLSLTPTEQATYYGIWQAFQTALGRQV